MGSTPVQMVRKAITGIPNVVFESGWDSPSISGKGVFAPRFVMLHHTAGTDSLKLLRDRNKYAPVRGAHFLVDRDGTVHVLSASVAYHAGAGKGFGVPDNQMNQLSWGIEIEDPGIKQTMSGPQIKATARLANGLLRAMQVDESNLIQHKEWSTTGKVDTRYPTNFWRQKVAEAWTRPPLPRVSLFDVQPGDVGRGVKLVQTALITQLPGVKIGWTERSFGRFGKTTRAAYARWQRLLGYKGRDADGSPGAVSLTRLGQKSGLFTT